MPISAPVDERPQAKSATTKIGFVSLGCPKNLVDSEVMMGMLAASGAEITPHADQADVIVVNTCSFIDTAKQESVDTILQIARHKQSAENPAGRAQKLIVAGCLVERYRNEIQKESLPQPASRRAPRGCRDPRSTF
jgi:ribosomal protein S12 methylthiotransferase